MQAIITKYHGATNTRGSRISARSQAGRKFYSWDYALGVEENHKAAAQQYASEMKWGREWEGGALPDDTGYAFVRVLR